MSVDQDRLDSLQRWMIEALIAPDGVDAGTIAATLLPGPKLSASACLAIYQRSYILRLRKCLEEQFPASYHALGATLFADFANEYLRACPSDSYTLHELGRRFPEWLEDNRPDRDQPP
ncbi:MAG TPA: DNA-binding domain-containing protein, partial [Dongiaceae bacterium]|nr:DNA-binding domain-containing protein [Dongiaceae bacterium]